MDDLASWFLVNYDEVLGTVVALVYLFFSIKQNIWLWPLGLVSSAIYAYVFFRAKVYAGMGLQIYFVLMSVYGWIIWLNGKGEENELKSVKSVVSEPKLILKLIIWSVLLFIILIQILLHQTDSDIPYFDAYITSLSIVATWMLAKKYVEHWMVWILADSVAVGVYLSKNLYFTVILYSVYTIMAYIGYKTWKKDLIGEIS
ncbi:MAG: nicotinamide riboside transporter PnuC [Bacteroidales bacterium]